MLLFELNCVVLSHLLRSPLSRAQLAAMHLRIFITLGEVILGRSMYSLTSLLHSVIKGVRRKTDHTGLMVFLHLIVFALFFPLPRILFCQVCKQLITHLTEIFTQIFVILVSLSLTILHKIEIQSHHGTLIVYYSPKHLASSDTEYILLINVFICGHQKVSPGEQGLVLFYLLLYPQHLEQLTAHITPKKYLLMILPLNWQSSWPTLKCMTSRNGSQTTLRIIA